MLERQVRRMLADRRSQRAGHQLRRAVAVLRNMRASRPIALRSPSSTTTCARRSSGRPSCSSRASCARTQRRRAADRRLHVRQRAAGAALRHPERLRQPLPARHVRRPTRGGLLGQGSILTVTSYATGPRRCCAASGCSRTSSARRRRRRRRTCRRSTDNDADGTALSVRERLEQHRKNPVCASCHARMDPLGFALENFDAIGKWRDSDENGTPIDAPARCPTAPTFEARSSCGAILLEQPRAVRQDRHREAADLRARPRPRVLRPAGRPRDHARRPAAHDYRWSSIILGIVKSTPFQMRRSES